MKNIQKTIQVVLFDRFSTFFGGAGMVFECFMEALEKWPNVFFERFLENLEILVSGGQRAS